MDGGGVMGDVYKVHGYFVLNTLKLYRDIIYILVMFDRVVFHFHSEL